MPALLLPPADLSKFRYFVVRRHRDLGRYELIEPDRANTYDLGDVFAARRYLERAAGAYLGGRALDSATAFGASMAIPQERRAFGLDLCRFDPDSERGILPRDIDESRRTGLPDLDSEIIA